MKIAICSSISFNDKIIDFREKLIKQGHEVHIPMATQKALEGKLDIIEFLKIKEKQGDYEFRKNSEENLIKRYYNLIKNSDAILVLNFEKKGIKNYIGPNTFLEMGFAHVLNKKIFLLNDLPEINYSDELKEMDFTIINNDLSLIK